MNDRALARIESDIVACRACPRLVAWREQVAREKVPRFAEQTYWGRPVPGFGDPHARILIVGLAPAAHGGNRTGRIFTGDASGDFLFAALHRARLANQPVSRNRGDGLRLLGCYLAAVNRCVPPANRPTPSERDRCLPFLEREIEALGRFRWSSLSVPLLGTACSGLCGRGRCPFPCRSLDLDTGSRSSSARTTCLDAFTPAGRTP